MIRTRRACISEDIWRGQQHRSDFSCLRYGGSLGIRGDPLRAPLKRPIYHSTFVLKNLRGDLNSSHIMPTDSSLSADVSFYSLERRQRWEYLHGLFYVSTSTNICMKSTTHDATFCAAVCSNRWRVPIRNTHPYTTITPFDEGKTYLCWRYGMNRGVMVITWVQCWLLTHKLSSRKMK